MNDDALRASGFQFAPQSAVLVDLERGRIIGVNRAFSVLLGYSEEELTERPLDGVVPPVHRPALKDALEATRTSPLLGAETDLCLRREDGTDVRVRLRSRLIDDGVGGPVRAVVAVDEVERSNEEQDAFFAMLAHELRNRLSNFRLAVQILNRESAPEGSRWAWGLSVIDRQVGALTQLTDDLLDVSRMARDQLAPKREPVDLTAAAREATAAHAARQESGDARVEVTAEGPLIVAGDPARLRQVVELLLALGQTSGPEPPKIRLREQGGTVSLTVEGAGLHPDLFSDDLDMFAAAARAATHRPGLGLEPLLVAGLVARMDGTVAVTPGRVDIRLPRARSAAGRAPPPSSVPTALEAPPDPPAAGPDPHVLVVDDDPGAANTLAMLLSTWGLTVEVAHDGSRGLMQAIDRPPQAALLDLRLPGMDGCDLARELRARFGAGIKLIALTGLDDPADRARVRAAGFDHHLVKPVDVDELRKLLA